MNTHDNNNESTVTYHPPSGQRDYLRQDMEQSLAALISDFEAEHHIAINRIEIERDDRDERGAYTKLSRWPLSEHPHAPVARVLIVFAQGPLVSATPQPIELEHGELTEPPETIQEAMLRLAREEMEASQQAYEPEPVKTEREAYLYGGRYA